MRGLSNQRLKRTTKKITLLYFISQDQIHIISQISFLQEFTTKGANNLDIDELMDII